MNGEADTQSISSRIADFLSGLWGSVQQGVQSSTDAAVSDWERVKQGRLPNKGIEAISQLLSAYTPSTGLLPRVPANSLIQKVFRDPKVGWENMPIANPSVDPLISTLMHAPPESIRAMLLQALRQSQKNVGID